MLYLCMWLLGSPDADIVSVHLATDMECGFIAEDESFYETWDEFDYRVDVCCVTQGAHIEGLCLTHEKLGQLPLLTVYVLPV